MRHQQHRHFDQVQEVDPTRTPADEPAGHQGGETREAQTKQRRNAARVALSGVVPLILVVIGAARLIGWLTS